MAGIEVHIPYVNFKTNVQGFPTRINAPAEGIDIQQNLHYMSKKVKITPSISPLNTVDDIQWSIVEGSEYAYINSSTGELQIFDNAITQMIKVKAKSLTNPSIFDEQEIVVTYNSDSSSIKLIDYEIFVSGLSSEYNFVSTDEVYIITASLSPTSTRNSYIGYNIKEGEDIVTVKDVSFINSETKIYFSFNTPTAKYSDIVFSFYKEDQPNVKKDVSTRLSFYPTVLFKNIDGGPYYPGNTYKFDYYTVPVIADRNLDVSIIQNANYIAECYDSSQTGTSGTMNFVPKDVSTTSQVVFKFTDPNTDASNNITFEVEPAEEMPNYRIEVTGNKRDYYFDKDTSIVDGDIELEYVYSDPEDMSDWHPKHKNVITYREIPNTSTRLRVDVYGGSTSDSAFSKGEIYYTVYDVSGGSGKIGFTVKPIIENKDVSICIYDPNNTNIRADISFTVRSELDSEVQLRLPQREYNGISGKSYYNLVYTDASIIRENQSWHDNHFVYNLEYFKNNDSITLEYDYRYTRGFDTSYFMPVNDNNLNFYNTLRNDWQYWQYYFRQKNNKIILPNIGITYYMKDTMYPPVGTLYINRKANIKARTSSGKYDSLPVEMGKAYIPATTMWHSGSIDTIGNLNIGYSNAYTYLDWSGPGEGTTHQVSRPITFAANSTPYNSMYGYSNTECLVLCTSTNTIIKTATKNNEDTSLFTDFFEECYSNAYRIKVVDSINNYPTQYVYLNPNHQYVREFFDSRNTKEITYRHMYGRAGYVYDENGKPTNFNKSEWTGADVERFIGGVLYLKEYSGAIPHGGMQYHYYKCYFDPTEYPPSNYATPDEKFIIARTAEPDDPFSPDYDANSPKPNKNTWSDEDFSNALAKMAYTGAGLAAGNQMWLIGLNVAKVNKKIENYGELIEGNYYDTKLNIGDSINVKYSIQLNSSTAEPKQVADITMNIV